MEPEHIKNDRVDEARVVHEEKTIRNQPSSDKISGRSIIFLKQVPDQLKRMEGFMRLSWAPALGDFTFCGIFGTIKIKNLNI